MKKIIAIILSVMMVLVTSTYVFADTALADSDDFVVWAHEDWTTGDGFYKVNNTTYEITTPAGFVYFYNTMCDGTTYKGCTVKLKNNLDLGNCLYSAQVHGLYKKAVNIYFEGTFDGENHTIRCVGIITIDKIGGLFGNIKNATIKNLALEELYTWAAGKKTSSDWGMIAACAYGNNTISNVKVLAFSGAEVIRVYENAGGFVGHVKEGATLYIDNCENSLGLWAYRDNVGGFVGLVDKNAYVSIYNSKNTGLIKSRYTENITTYYEGVSDGVGLFTESEMATLGQYLGGIIGTVYGSVKLFNVENTGEVYSVTDNTTGGEAGGLIGRLDWNGGLDAPSIEKSINRGKVTGYLSAGGIIGWVGNDSNDQNYDIRYCQNYGAIESKTSEAGGIIGHFDTDGCGQYFFGGENYGTITGYQNAGGIIGYSEAGGEFHSCKNEAAVTSKTKNAGGIIGATEDDANSYADCSNTGNITGCENAGGIVGYAGDHSNDPIFSFTFCKNSGKIQSENGLAGGIVGCLDTDGCGQYFDKDENYGQVSAPDDAGGIIGYTRSNGTLSNCKNAGTISGSNKAGGIIGEVKDDDWTISYCSNSAWVLGMYHSGGIAGDLGNDDDDPTFSITNCSNSGTVYSQESDAGGIIGLLDTDSGDNKLQYNTNTGYVSACRMAGGICGYTLGDADFYGSKSQGSIYSYGDAGCHAAGMLGGSENSFDVSSLMKSCTVKGEIESTYGKVHKLYGEAGEYGEDGKPAKLTASIFGVGDTWMLVSLAEILVFGCVIVVLATKLKRKNSTVADIDSDAAE